jgi:hypothetical protein
MGVCPVLTARCALVQAGVESYSSLYVFGSRNRIVKIRITSPVAEAATARLQSAASLKAVAAWLR